MLTPGPVSQGRKIVCGYRGLAVAVAEMPGEASTVCVCAGVCVSVIFLKHPKNSQKRDFKFGCNRTLLASLPASPNFGPNGNRGLGKLHKSILLGSEKPSVILIRKCIIGTTSFLLVC